MHENLSPGVCGHMYVWIVFVKVCVCTGVLSPGVYGLWYVGLHVLVHVLDVCVQSSPCEHVASGRVWPVLNEDLGAPAVSLNLAWGKAGI